MCILYTVFIGKECGFGLNHSYFLSNFAPDVLSLFFAAVILLIAIPIGIYSTGYMREYKGKYSLRYFALILILFLLSMLGVVFSRNAFSFMVFWEIMSLSSFFLVIFEYRNRETIKAGVMYLIMTHISGLLLLIMFSFIFKYTGSFDFSIISQQLPNIPGSRKTVIFILALAGFGAKAGIIPLHPWLPKAHPAAPSNVSALMSGVMLKVALYGFIRLTFVLLDGVPLVLGVITMVIGTLTAIFSILNALFQEDIKKLLAYSSAENIGIIVATLGLSMVFAGRSLMVLSSLALTAAIFHILNHAVFKSLLFSGAGSVLFATGTRNMNELGGLHKRMRVTAICTFIGTAAISAVPPLNGFASEILILKSFIMSAGSIHSLGLMISLIICGVLIALTGGGAMFAAVKCFGITFLGASRSSRAAESHDIPLSMNVGMGILAAMSTLLGLFSPAAVSLIARVSAFTLKTNEYLQGSEAKAAVSFDITIAALLITAVALSVYILLRINSRDKAFEINDTWGCGFNNMQPYMQYSGSGYVQPASRVVHHFVEYRKEVKQRSSISIKQKTSDVIEKYIYEPVTVMIRKLADLVSKIHYGKIQLYVSYIFLSLIVTMILVISLI